MAKLEVPSIVVDKGSHPSGLVGTSLKMESQRSIRAQRTLSKQEEIDEDDHLEMSSSIPRTEVYTSSAINCEDQRIPPTRPVSLNMLQRSRSHSKVKLLVRSHAMREESPDGGAGGSDCEGEGSRIGRHRLRREGSSTDQTSWSEPALSRGNSREQYDGSSNTIDLHQFIVETLNRNCKDRMLLFRIENELVSLLKDSKRNSHKFNQMSSYQRMLVHRVAAYFGMEHNVDPTGLSVIVNTCKATRLPERRFRDFVREDLLEEPRRSILKRDSSSFDETGSFKNGEKLYNGDSRRSKSFEEREEEYEKIRRRIFNYEHLTDADIECMEEYHNWDNDGSNGCPRCAHHSERSVRLLKVESYESGDTLKANSLRLSVSKSHSFNGYDQTSASQTTRVLTKQDSGSSMSSRISPSQSSGYKSQRSDATLSATPSPSATPSLHTQLSGQSGGAMSPEPETPVVWAVTDMASVPPGSMLIHPQTGQPYTNADGSIYHYDPANPPHCVNEPLNNTAPANQAPPPPLLTQKSVMEDCGVMGSEKALIDRGAPGAGRYEAVSVPSGYAPVAPTSPSIYAYGPPPPPQHQLPLVVPPHPPDQYLYQAPAHHCPSAPAPPPPPDPRLATPDNGALINNELSACMMGMSLEGRPDRQQPLMYWQPHHIQSGVPMYYSGASHVTAAATSTRYHQAVTPAPPFSQIVPHQLPPPPPPIDHTVAAGCYSNSGYTGGSSSAGPGSPECIPSYPSTIHMYYPACTSAGSIAAGSTYYTGASVSPTGCPPPLVAAQPPAIPYPPTPPCAHPSSPQNVCSQLTVYNGCYPAGAQYSANSTTITAVPQIFRKSSLQVGVGCNSPLRSGGYPVSSLKERGLEENKAPPAAIQPATIPPFYGIRVLPTGDVRLFNPGRLPFSVQTSKPFNRKHKFKMGGGMRNYGGDGSSSHHVGPPGTSPFIPASSSDLTKA